MTRLGYIVILILPLLALCADAFGIERFPPPDFTETGHEFPQTTAPPPDSPLHEYLDAGVLFAALSVATYLIYKKRSRRWIFGLMVFSVIYFGFWRKGCICPIGAIQNVTLTIFDSNYAIPVSALIFFLLPLAFSLFVGRVFCASVCPLGAVQDLILFRPVSVAGWLESALRLLAYAYLAAAVLFAATGSAFVICRYDPFVAFFRLSGNLNIVIMGLSLLIVGVFIGRPYCRFLCPYGLILRQFSRLSRRKVTITPDECIKCRLCEDACPFGAVRTPTAPWPESDYPRSKKTLACLILVLPVLILLAGWAGLGLSARAARVNDTVRLADRIYMENAGLVTDTTDASNAFRATGRTAEELYAEADAIGNSFALGAWLCGAFLGLVAGLKLIRHTTRPVRTEYRADKASCLACGRCYAWCPREHLRLKESLREPTRC